MTDLSQIYRKPKLLDPYDPFNNPTENPDYSQDYTDIVPAVAKPGCMIPLEPNRNEKRNIRKYYNITSALFLIFFLISIFLPSFLAGLAISIISGYETAAGADTGTADYARQLLKYISEQSSVFVGLNLVIHLIFNTLIAFIGLKILKVRTGELFGVRRARTGDYVKYAAIGLGFYLAISVVLGLINNFFASHDVELTQPTDITGMTMNAKILYIIYCCLIAPVTEEFFFRGFMMKGLSRVSQRFGIIAAAVFFALAHGNLLQGILAVVIGIYFGHIDVKHNSIFPSIICHITINTFGTLISFIGEPRGNLFSIIFGLLNLLLVAGAAVGVIFMLRFIYKNPMPYNTPHQSRRGLRLALTSPVFTISLIVGIGTVIAADFAGSLM